MGGDLGLSPTYNYTVGWWKGVHREDTPYYLYGGDNEIKLKSLESFT